MAGLHHNVWVPLLFCLVQFTPPKTIQGNLVNPWCLRGDSLSRPYGNKSKQSGTYQDNQSHYGVARAIDGDPNTCSKTAVKNRPNVQLAFGHEINVSVVIIKNSNDKNVTIVRIAVQTESVGGSGQQCGFKHYLKRGETRVVRCVPALQGKAIKILDSEADRDPNTTESLSLCEVMVFNDTAIYPEGVNYTWFEVEKKKDKRYYSSLDSLFDDNKYKEEYNDNVAQKDKFKSRGVFASFQSPRNLSTHYGLNLTTFYRAPQTGRYIFYMSGDDSCRLLIKYPENANFTVIANIPQEAGGQYWTRYDSWNDSVSKPQNLEKDKVYRLEAIMKQGIGQDHLRVGVQLPNGEYERPLKNGLYTSEYAAKMRLRNPCNKKEPTTTMKAHTVEPTTAESEIQTAMESLRQYSTSDETKLETLTKLEKLGMDKAKSLNVDNTSSASYIVETGEFVFGAVALNLKKFTGFTFPGSLDDSFLFVGGSIYFPDTMFDQNQDRAYMVCMTFRPLEHMQENTGGSGNTLGQHVLSVVVEPRPPAKMTKPVELVFTHAENANQSDSDCVFWIEDENSTAIAKYGRWSNEGCVLARKNVTHIVCHCNHLTKFSLLFPVIEGSEKDDRRIEMITYVGLAMSAIGCFITFIVYLILRITKTLKTVVHMNLVLALGLADIFFLLGNFAEQNKTVCFACAVLTFYLYLAVFGWMLIEGIHLYFLVIKVFGRDDCLRKRLYYVIGWGIPLVIVCVTGGLMGDDMVAKRYCWLSVENGAIWAFVGPVLFVILINILVLCAVLRTTLTVLRRDPGHRKEKSAMRTLALLMPILGVTWVIGVVAFAHDSIIPQYLFAICNAFQGFFIFLLYCLFSSEVRHEYQRKLSAWKTGREIESKRSKQNNSDFQPNMDLLT